MDGYIPWYQSQSIWANIFQIATGIGVAAHALSSEAAGALVSQGPSLAVGAVTTVLGAWALWHRVTATKQIAATKANAEDLNAHADEKKK